MAQNFLLKVSFLKGFEILFKEKYKQMIINKITINHMVFFYKFLRHYL